MALGNANTSAQARGKNKATKIKKRKEIEAAENYTSFSISNAEKSVVNACSVSNSNINNTCFHDGSHPSNLPISIGDKIYTEKRLSANFALKEGFYKVGPDSKSRTYGIQIGQGGQVSAVSNCP